MQIHGREVHFLLTVGATKKVTKFCPDNDISNIGLIFEGKDTSKMIDLIASISEAMSEGYESNQYYLDKSYVPNPLTIDEVMTLGISELATLEEEIMREIGVGTQTEIETEPEKGIGKKTENNPK